MPTAAPSLDPLATSWDLLRHGLRIDGPMGRGVDGHDLVSVRLGRRRVFVLRHPDLVDHVLHEAADRYHKSVEYELLRTVLGLNLFTDEGESWRRHRMLLNPLMSKRHVRGMVDLMIDPIDAFLARLEDGPERVEIEMAGAMVELTLDVVGAALFGHRFGAIAGRMRRAVTAGLRGAEVATRWLMVAGPPAWLVRGCAAVIHHAPMLPRGLGQMQWVMRTVDEAIWELIDERRAHPTEGEDLLNLLLHAEDDHGRLPLRRVRDEATTFMLAGHETTANALAWMWYLLALNPEARRRMLAEVDAVLGDRRPAAHDVAALPWTTACFQEAMRCFPPAWSIPRVAITGDEIAGHRIPRGSSVIIPIHAIHHDARFWPDPERFDPQRFMPGEGSGRHRTAYLPFGGGRRVCIGSSFALMETTLITAMLSRRFVFDLAPGHQVEPEATLTLRPRRGVKMVGTRR